MPSSLPLFMTQPSSESGVDGEAGGKYKCGDGYQEMKMKMITKQCLKTVSFYGGMRSTSPMAGNPYIAQAPVILNTVNALIL